MWALYMEICNSYLFQAQFVRDGYASQFTCSSRFYSEALLSFHSSIIEVTWYKLCASLY